MTCRVYHAFIACIIILVLAVGAAPVAALATHSCVHDSVIVPLLRAEELAFPNATRPTAVAPYELSPGDRAAGRSLAIGPMRFVVRTPDLYDASKYCTSATGTSSNMQGGSTACSEDTVLTDAKRDVLLNQLLPEALRRLSASLAVTQVTGNLVVPRGACSSFTIPTADSTTGVANADFVLYVSAAPAAAGTIAWAGYCSRDAAGRPVVGRTNISPRYIENAEYYIRVVMHELAHALGFSGALLLGTAQTTRGTIRGKSATFVTTPKVVAAYREFVGCATAVGPEIEDEGGSGTAGSHWERRNLRDDLMCGIAGAGRLSKHTLAVFEDSGLYTVDYATTESMAWGSGTGCAFLDQKCTSAAAGMGTYWCDAAGAGCTFDRKAIGACDLTTFASALPAAFQYFSDPTKGGSSSGLMDYCPTVVGYSNRQCDDATYAATSSDLIFGLTFASAARCFDTTSFIKSGYSTTSYPRNTCLKVRCVDGARLEVAVHNTGWVACPASGAAGSVTVTGYSGSIQCPAASAFCSDKSLAYSATSSTSSVPNAPPPPPPPPTTTTTTTTTTSTTTSQTFTTTVAPPVVTTTTTAEVGTETLSSNDGDGNATAWVNTTTVAHSGNNSSDGNSSNGDSNATNANFTSTNVTITADATSTTILTTTTTESTVAPETTTTTSTPAPAVATTKAPSLATTTRYYILVLRGRYLGLIAGLPSFSVSLVADLATAFSTTSSSVTIEELTLLKGTAAPSDSDGLSQSGRLLAAQLDSQPQQQLAEENVAMRLSVAFSVTPLTVSGVATAVEDLTFLATSGTSVSWLVQVRALHRAAALAAAATTATTSTPEVSTGVASTSFTPSVTTTLVATTTTSTDSPSSTTVSAPPPVTTTTTAQSSNITSTANATANATTVNATMQVNTSTASTLSSEGTAIGDDGTVSTSSSDTAAIRAAAPRPCLVPPTAVMAAGVGADLAAVNNQEKDGVVTAEVVYPTDATVVDGGSDADNGVGDGGNGATTATATSIPGDDLAVVSASLDPVRTGGGSPIKSAAVTLSAAVVAVIVVSVTLTVSVLII